MYVCMYVSHGMVWYGMWSGTVWYGHGVVWYAKVSYGLVWYDMVMVRSAGLVWMVWYGLVWSGSLGGCNGNTRKRKMSTDRTGERERKTERHTQTA